MWARRHHEIDSIRASVERTRRLSDRIVGVGPFTLGLDGVLAWIPLVGLVYSVAAGGFLIMQGVRARVGARALAKMAGLLTADAITDAVPIPIASAAVDMVFTGHKWAADALLKAMDETVYYPGDQHEAQADPSFRALQSRMASGEEPRRRVVYLGRA